MRVLILTSCATADRTFAADEEHELDDAVAHELLRAGLAQPVVLPFTPEPADTGEIAAAELPSAETPNPRRRSRPRKRA